MRWKAKLPLWSTYFHQEPTSIERKMPKKKTERKPSLKCYTPSLASDALDKVDLIALNLAFWEHCGLSAVVCAYPTYATTHHQH